jgi:hypothetical protein
MIYQVDYADAAYGSLIWENGMKMRYQRSESEQNAVYQTKMCGRLLSA